VDAEVQQLIAKINSLSKEQRAVTPFPPEWEIKHNKMLVLVDTGWLGMDGFKYQFVEYARESWRRCHRA
jgi:hypothetical protein